jgi:hypothetical protein
VVFSFYTESNVICLMLTRASIYHRLWTKYDFLSKVLGDDVHRCMYLNYTPRYIGTVPVYSQ